MKKSFCIWSRNRLMGIRYGIQASTLPSVGDRIFPGFMPSFLLAIWTPFPRRYHTLMRQSRRGHQVLEILSFLLILELFCGHLISKQGARGGWELWGLESRKGSEIASLLPFWEPQPWAPIWRLQLTVKMWQKRRGVSENGGNRHEKFYAYQLTFSLFPMLIIVVFFDSTVLMTP